MQMLLPPPVYAVSLWQILEGTSAFGVVLLIVLVLMSLSSWVIIFHKWRQFRQVEQSGEAFLNSFRRSRKMSEAIGQAKSHRISPLAQVFLAGFEELNSLLQKKSSGASPDNAEALTDEDYEVLEMTLDRTATEAVGHVEKQTVFLATTGNSAPFIGLLGTVVGIMESFWAIGERGSASLAVVAPGIAEALLATIVGLATAIPAVIAFNWAGNKAKFLNDATNGFIMEFMARVRKEAR
jgi:biopolymer transport protein TolQ